MSEPEAKKAASPSPDPSAKKPIEEWGKKKQTKQWIQRAAFFLKGWVAGAELTEKEYDEAVHEAAHGRVV